MSHDMQRMKHPGYKRPRGFKCPLCVVSSRKPTCGFDGRHKLFKATHYNCETLWALKGALRIVGTRALQDEERENRTTAWQVRLDDGTMVLCCWKRGYDSGFMDFGLEGKDTFGPLRLETAHRVLDLAKKTAEARAMGMSDEELEDLRERMGEDE